MESHILNITSELGIHDIQEFIVRKIRPTQDSNPSDDYHSIILILVDVHII